MIDIKMKGVDKLKAKLKELEQIGDTEIMAGIGNMAVDLLKKRTETGSDISDHGFKNYSKDYQKQTGKPNPPNLKNTGSLLNSVKSRVIDKFTVVIRVIGDKFNVGLFHQEGIGKNPKRQWFGLSLEDKKSIKTQLKKLLLAKIKKQWTQ